VIGVTGYYGYGNVGDDILLRNLLKSFGTRDVVVYVPAEKACGNIKAQFDCMVSTTQFLPDDSKQLDLLIFGGGGVLHDSAMLNLWPKRVIEQVKCPIALLGVGIPHGEGFMLVSHKIDYIVDKACFVGLRDFNSKAIFEQLWSKPCTLFPDLAYLTERINAKKSTDLLLQFKYVPSDYRKLAPKGFNTKARRQINAFNGEMFCWESANCESALRALASARGCLGVSLHFGLMSLTQKVPILMLQYQGKVRSVLGLVTHGSRIIYPSKVRRAEDFLPIEDYSASEMDKFFAIKEYLKSCMNRIQSFRFDDMPEYPLAVPQIRTKFKLGIVKPKPKFLRDMKRICIKIMKKF
jgi:polysaccharide pyruvyl transferase WcaK-like protein